MKKDKKISTVNEFREVLENSSLLVVSDYRGLDVERISVLRRNCRKSGGSLKVIKNTLARRAVAGTRFAPADPLLQGPTAVAVASGDPVDVIKALTSFSRENDVFKIKGGVLDGSAYSAEDLFRIATLPSREVLLARLVGSLASPMSRMVGSLGSPLRGLVGVLQALKDARAAQAA